LRSGAHAHDQQVGSDRFNHVGNVFRECLEGTPKPAMRVQQFRLKPDRIAGPKRVKRLQSLETAASIGMISDRL
jgi:hypothetical protein